MKGTSIERIAELIGDIVATVIENYKHFIKERQTILDQSQDATFDEEEFEELTAKLS